MVFPSVRGFWAKCPLYLRQVNGDKIQFLQELTNLKIHMLPTWLVLGDFNLILNAHEKNNAQLNLPLINRFKATVDNLQLTRNKLRGKNTPGAMIINHQQ